MLILIRAKGAKNAFRMCRLFGVGLMQSLWRAFRYAVTGRTGKYKIRWRPESVAPVANGSTARPTARLPDDTPGA
jgi:hypothetical protein